MRDIWQPPHRERRFLQGSDLQELGAGEGTRTPNHLFTSPAGPIRAGPPRSKPRDEPAGQDRDHVHCRSPPSAAIPPTL